MSALQKFLSLIGANPVVVAIAAILALGYWLARPFLVFARPNEKVQSEIKALSAEMEPLKQAVRDALKSGGQIAASGPLRLYTDKIEALCGMKLREFLPDWSDGFERESFLMRASVYNEDWRRSEIETLAKLSGNIDEYLSDKLIKDRRISVQSWARLDWMSFVGKEYLPYAS